MAKKRRAINSRVPSERQWRAEGMMMDAVKKSPKFKGRVRQAVTMMDEMEKKIMKGMM